MFYKSPIRIAHLPQSYNFIKCVPLIGCNPKHCCTLVSIHTFQKTFPLLITTKGSCWHMTIKDRKKKQNSRYKGKAQALKLKGKELMVSLTTQPLHLNRVAAIQWNFDLMNLYIKKFLGIINDKLCSSISTINGKELWYNSTMLQSTHFASFLALRLHQGSIVWG